MSGTQAVRERLLADRGNGATNGALRTALVSGAKLSEAARYAKSSRLALLNWTSEVYHNQDNVDAHTEHVREALEMAEQFERLRMRLDAKASVFGV
jgi:hypothetical protein